MADMPTGGAGGAGGLAAGGAVQDEATAAVSRASSDAGDAAQAGKASHDRDAGQAGGAGGTSAPGEQEPGDGVDSLTQAPATPAAPAAPPAPALGAGGTSEVGDDEDDAGMGIGEPSGGAKMAGAAAAVPAAGMAAQMMVLAMFINWLKGMLMAMAAIAMNLWNLFLGMLLAGAKAVLGAIMGFGAGVANFVGGGISALAAGIGSALAGLFVTATLVVGGVASTNASDAAQRDEGSVEMLSCVAEADSALDDVVGANPDVTASTVANAKTVYSVLSAWGMPDENIAGILGNWDAESGIDPTGVETIFGEPFHLGPRKLAAQAALFDVTQVAPAYGQKFPGVKTVGVGLGQWSNGRNPNLMAYAQAAGVSWSTVETQLGFMISAAEGANATIVKNMITTSLGSPGAAALHFHDKWERSADTAAMAQRRVVAADKWMGMFSGWEKNQALADSILAQSGATVVVVDGDRAETIRADCRGAEAPPVTVAEGGMTLEQATAFMATYRAEGEEFLQSKYGSGGPGRCSGGKADNCVGFSTYFVNKFTSFQQYAPGNGKDTARSMASMMGKLTTKANPTAYSVVSGPGSGAEGHTFVILGIQGDQAVVGEAACGSNHKYTRARLMPLSTLNNGAWTFVDVTDLIVTQPLT